MARYEYLVKTAPPEQLEQVHREAFERLTPAQRAQVDAQLRSGLPAGERPVSSSPADLARSATRGELRQPGTLRRILSSGGARTGLAAGGLAAGGIAAGGLLAAVAGGAVLSSAASGLLSQAEAAGVDFEGFLGEGLGGADELLSGTGEQVSGLGEQVSGFGDQLSGGADDLFGGLGGLFDR